MGGHEYFAAGSTALQPLVTAAAETYQAQHSDVKISVTGGGSKTGLSLVGNKAVDLGNSDILAPAGSALVDHKVAVVGFSVIVNPASGVTNLTKKQVQDIFSGKVSNWKTSAVRTSTSPSSIARQARVRAPSSLRHSWAGPI